MVFGFSILSIIGLYLLTMEKEKFQKYFSTHVCNFQLKCKAILNQRR